MIGNNIADARKKRGISQRGLAIKTGITNATISRIEKGLVTPDIATLQKLSQTLGVPINILLDENLINNKIIATVLGSIPAGIPLEAIEDIIDYEELDPEHFKNVTYYGLKVRGDSMAPEIKNNDIVILKVQDDCESGDICAVMVNGFEATLKRVKKDAPGITLIPLNTAGYMPQFFSNEQIETLPIKIIGKVVEVRRSY